MRILDLLKETGDLDNEILEGDYFDIELDDIIIETSVVSVRHNSIIISADETAMNYIISEMTRRGFMKGLGGAIGLAATGSALGKVTLGQPVLTMDDEEHGTLLYQGKKIPVINLAKGGMNLRTMKEPIQANYNNKFVNVIVVSDEKAYINAREKFNPFAQNEAEYQGRNVPLGKPMAGDVKKSKVYVKGPSGRVVKVNFGDKNMKIKKSNPVRRKSFRARHNCASPGPRHKAKYWSCRAWE